jgi:hypothetical protein
MKKLLPLLVLLGIANGWIFSQVVVTTPPYSKYNYPGHVLAGSERQELARVWGGNAQCTAYSFSGSTLTLTCNNTYTAGDVVWANGFTSSALAYLNYHPYTIVSRTSTTIVLNYSGGSGSGTEANAFLFKTQGAGFTGLGTAEIISTGSDASETFRLYSEDHTADSGLVAHPTIAHVPAYFNFQVGPVAGVTSTTGSITSSNFAIHSTVEFDVKWTSDDDPTKFSIHHYVVGANGGGYAGVLGKAFANPGTRDAFTDRYIPLKGEVYGNTNQAMDWTIVSAPGGGNATLQFATFPQPVFYSGTVAGTYYIKACPHVDSSTNACTEIAINVFDHTTLPAANADKVEQVPCPAGNTDGVTWGTIYEIGPTQTYHSLLDIPQTLTGPVKVRLHNEGANGSPTEYHNQVQINTPSGGPFTDRKPAFKMCGVPNPTTGELPIIDGANATVNSWASPYIVGPYALFGLTNASVGFGTFNGQTQPFSYVLISGVHVRNVSPGYNYNAVTGGTAAWGGSMGIRPTGIQNFNKIGVHDERVANSNFDDCNPQQSGWQACSIDTFYEGNHMEAYGSNGSFLDHPFYLQADRAAAFLNLEDGAVAGSQGTSFFSDRGSRSFHMYNRLQPTGSNTSASYGGGHSERQDSYNYDNEDEFYGYQGAPNCNTLYASAPFCLGVTGVNPVDWFAARLEEHAQTDFVIGNALYYQYGVAAIGSAMTHNFESFQTYAYPAAAYYPGNLTQKQWVSYNTIIYNPTAMAAGGIRTWENIRVGFAGLEPPDRWFWPFYYPQDFWANNIMPSYDNTNCQAGGIGTCNAFTYLETAFVSFQSNMTTAGGYTPGSTVNVTYSNAPPQAGLYIEPSFFDVWGNPDPINKRLNGWTAPNFINYSVYPVDLSSLKLVSGSQAIGQATPLTGVAAMYPPRFNAVDANMSPFTLRTDLTTLGAYDPSGGPTVVSIAVTPNPLSTPISTSGTLVCTATLSDSSTRACFAPACTSTNTGSMTISGLNWTATSTPGTGTLNCTAETLTAPGDAFTVTGAAPTQTMKIGGNVSFSGSVAIQQ